MKLPLFNTGSKANPPATSNLSPPTATVFDADAPSWAFDALAPKFAARIAPTNTVASRNELLRMTQTPSCESDNSPSRAIIRRGYVPGQYAQVGRADGYPQVS